MWRNPHSWAFGIARAPLQSLLFPLKPFAMRIGAAKSHYIGTLAGMRKFLVILDDSRECLNAMQFAALRASNTGGGVVIMSIIPPDEFSHWVGVADIMRAEARERIEAHFNVFATWMKSKAGIEPELVIREGEAVPEILSYIKENGEIGILVLGAGVSREGPGPIVSQLSRSSGTLPVPITIVPLELSHNRIKAIT